MLKEHRLFFRKEERFNIHGTWKQGKGYSTKWA